MIRSLLCAWVAFWWTIAGQPVRGQSAQTGARIPCTDGIAAGFPCRNVDLLAYLPIAEIGGRNTLPFPTRLNDIWGWTDPETGREYALVGRTDGTSFVDVTDPLNPVYLGDLPLPDSTRSSAWRDIKVYADHAFVVADDPLGPHGMQVFDLRALRDVDAPPVTFDETARYRGFHSAHNIVINEETGYAYAVGIRGFQTGSCGPGLHFIDIREPAAPVYAGCFANPSTGRGNDGYVHDAQCVVYRGPDADYQDREICFGANETAVDIVDVTDKARPVSISVATYPNARYVHQGWLTEDQRYFLVDDELDEAGMVTERTRTIICDVTDLDEPLCTHVYLGTTGSSDHNQYVVGNLAFQANYRSGLRILDITDVTRPTEAGYFDTYPPDDAPGFSNGAWSNYPFFASGIVVVSSIREGFFVLRPSDAIVATEAAETPASFTLAAPYPNPFNPQSTVTLDVDAPQFVRMALYDVLGRMVAVVHEGTLAAGRHRFTIDGGTLPSGTYLLRARGAAAVATRRLTLLR